MLLFGAVSWMRLFWFDLVSPVTLFATGFRHFLGHYSRLAHFASLPVVLNILDAVPASR